MLESHDMEYTIGNLRIVGLVNPLLQKHVTAVELFYWDVKNVVEMLANANIKLVYDDRFLESAVGDVIAKPTLEQADAWKRLMEVTDDE